MQTGLGRSTLELRGPGTASILASEALEGCGPGSASEALRGVASKLFGHTLLCNYEACCV
eukprot:15484204-Alexandrium_andersonii.AAC.1